jgi:predicted nucleotidyltransferase
LGTLKIDVADALFPASRKRVLGFLYGQPERTFALSELIELARSGHGAVQRELSRLTASGLVRVIRDHRRRRYQANPSTPVFEELRSLVGKTMGVTQRVHKAVTTLGPRVQLVLLFGSTAKGGATPSSDIDLLLVSDELTLEDVLRTMEPLERELGRRVDTTIYTHAEFSKRLHDDNPFLTKVLEGEHVVLLGSLDDFAAR